MNTKIRPEIQALFDLAIEEKWEYSDSALRPINHSHPYLYKRVIWMNSIINEPIFLNEDEGDAAIKLIENAKKSPYSSKQMMAIDTLKNYLASKGKHV